MSDDPLLELRLYHGDGGRIAADMYFRTGDSAVEAELARAVLIDLQLDRLLEVTLDPVVYGRTLSEMVFANTALQMAWERAAAFAEGQGRALRFLLRLDARDLALSSIRWELLWEPRRDGFIFLSERIASARYLVSADLSPVRPAQASQLRALVVIAEPTDIAKYGLAPVDVEREQQQILQSLGGIPASVLSRSSAGIPVTIAALRQELIEGYDILILVVQSRLYEGEPYYYFEDASGQVEPIMGSQLSRLLADLQRRPLLSIIFSTASSGSATSIESGGAWLAAAGLPAVISSQGTLSNELAARFLSVLFRELLRDGDIVRAVAVTRAECRYLADWWMPVLIIRVRDGKLWQGERQIGKLPAASQPRPTSSPTVERPTEAAVSQPAPPPLPTVSVGNRGGAFNDMVGQRDLLGVSTIISAFVDLIESPDTPPPLTIGIFGAWGTGKSFILDAIVRELRRRRETRKPARQHNPASSPPATAQVYDITFNAWMYNASEKIWPSLVRELVRYFTEERRVPLPRRLRIKYQPMRRQVRRDLPRITTIAALLLAVVAFALFYTRFDLMLSYALLSALGVGTLVTLITQLFQQPLAQWFEALFTGEEYGAGIAFMDETREDLDLLHTQVLKRNERVLIVIDDLDRCEPAKAVEVLQAINQLLNFPRFIVCLGVDAQIISLAAEKHYQNLLGEAGASGYAYLDKIIHIPFQIPKPTPLTLRNFIAGQMQAGVDGTALPGSPPYGSASLPRFTSSEAEQPEPQRRQVDPEELTPKLPTPPIEHVAFTGLELSAFQDLAVALRPNPRYLKRLLNVYRLVRTLAQYGQDATVLANPTAIAGWLLICAQWPSMAYTMLWHLEQIEETIDPAEEHPAYPAPRPLSELLKRARATIDREERWSKLRARIDDDPADLARVVSQLDTRVTWEELRKLRYYTVNFNPSVEAELRLMEAPVGQ